VKERWSSSLNLNLWILIFKKNMIDFENLRNKSEHYRRTVTFGLSSLATVLILFAWLFVFLPSQQKNVSADRGQEIQSPLASIKEGFSSSWSFLSTGLSDLKEELDDKLRESFPASTYDAPVETINSSRTDKLSPDSVYEAEEGEF
jgi:hypothetical protein